MYVYTCYLLPLLLHTCERDIVLIFLKSFILFRNRWSHDIERFFNIPWNIDSKWLTRKFRKHDKEIIINECKWIIIVLYFIFINFLLFKLPLIVVLRMVLLHCNFRQKEVFLILFNSCPLHYARVNNFYIQIKEKWYVEQYFLFEINKKK